MVCSEFFRISCSQIRITFQPVSRKYFVVRLSRRRLLEILVLQKSFFRRCFHRGYCQPCQKSLSRKTQHLYFLKTISGRPRMSRAYVTNFLFVACFNFVMNKFSNFVLVERIFDILAERFRGESLSGDRCFLKSRFR